MEHGIGDIVASLSRLAAELISPASEFPMVVLYHGSFLSNLDSILSKGIVPQAINAEATVSKAVDEIVSVLRLSDEQKRELWTSTAKYAIDRVKQSKFDKVYLSGERSFAESNAKAGGEWYEEIVRSALRMINEDYYELEADYSRRNHNIERQMKEQDKKLAEMTGNADYETYHKESLISRELDKQHDELQKEQDKALSVLRQEIKRQEQEVLRVRFGDEAVIFTVEIPYQIFVGKIASSDSKQRIQLFEEMYVKYVGGGKGNWFDYIRGNSGRVWEFFQEVHLSGVEPKFIRRWERI